MRKEREQVLDRLIGVFEEERRKTLQSLSASWFSFLAEELASGENPEELLEAMDYATYGGKRLRPRLYFATLLNYLDEESIKGPVYMKAALALEFVHSYSLIHDDLPAMDNDRYRRGRLSVHARYGEARAILCGDALLTLAFRLMTDPTAADEVKKPLSPGDEAGPSGKKKGRQKAVEPKDPIRCEERGSFSAQSFPGPAERLKATQTLAVCAGMEGMVGGQELDMDPDRLKGTDAIERMVRKKTCALFLAAVCMAGQLAGASERDLESLRKYALAYGLAFQLWDDIADQEKDQAEGKITLMTPLKDEKEGAEEVKEHLKQAHEAVSELNTYGYLSDFLDSVLQLLHKE